MTTINITGSNNVSENVIGSTSSKIETKSEVLDVVAKLAKSLASTSLKTTDIMEPLVKSTKYNSYRITKTLDTSGEAFLAGSETMRYRPAIVSVGTTKLLVVTFKSHIVAYNLSTEVVAWAKHISELFSDALIATRDFSGNVMAAANLLGPATSKFRNTVFQTTDNSENLLWISNAGEGQTFVAALNTLTGDVKYEFDAYPEFAPGGDVDQYRVPDAFGGLGPGSGNIWSGFNALNMSSGALRNGLHVEWNSVTEKYEIYLGIQAWSEYVYRNLLTQQDRQAIGAFSMTGNFKKVSLDISGTGPSADVSNIWVFRTMPKELTVPDLSGGRIPVECFRPGNSKVQVAVKLYDGMPLPGGSREGIHYLDSDVSGVPLYIYTASGEWGVSGTTYTATELWDVSFGNATFLDASATYSATKDSSAQDFSGWQIIGPQTPVASALNTIGIFCLDASFIVSGDEFSRWAVYNLNSYGSSIWMQDVLVDSSFIKFPVGNATRHSTEVEQFLKNKATEDTLITQYLTNQITFSQLQEQTSSLTQYESQLPPRARRNTHDSIVTLHKDTGKLHQILKSTSKDSWDLAEIGGVGEFIGAPIIGQPANRPYLFAYGPDADACAPLRLDNGYYGSVTKGGLAIFTRDASNSLEPFIAGDIHCDNGISNESLDISGVTKRYMVGFNGVFGGANFGIATDGKCLFADMDNTVMGFSGAASLGMPTGWTTQDGRLIPRNTTYTTAVNENGIQWEEVNGRGGPQNNPCQLSVHNDIVWNTAKYKLVGLDCKTGVRLVDINAPTENQNGKIHPVFNTDADGVEKIYAIWAGDTTSGTGTSSATGGSVTGGVKVLTR